MQIMNRLSKPTGRKISYVVCLDCSKKIPYDLSQAIGKSITAEERFKFLECDEKAEKQTWDKEVID